VKEDAMADMALSSTNHAENGTELVGDTQNAQRYRNDFVLQVKTHRISGNVDGIIIRASAAAAQAAESSVTASRASLA
jgi:hypothetical protein